MHSVLLHSTIFSKYKGFFDVGDGTARTNQKMRSNQDYNSDYNILYCILYYNIIMTRASVLSVREMNSAELLYPYECILIIGTFLINAIR